MRLLVVCKNRNKFIIEQNIIFKVYFLRLHITFDLINLIVMKTNIFLPLLILLCLISASANSQKLSEGDQIVDAYYGVGIVSETVIRAITDNSSVKLSTIGPFGVRYEHLLHKNFSIGVDGNYSTNLISWTDNDSIISSFVSTYELTRKITRIMPRVNAHYCPNKSTDLFVGLSAGYRHVKYSISTNDPLFDEASLPGVNPFAFRMSIGGRYFINKFIGLNAELGLGGGSIICGGISFKF